MFGLVVLILYVIVGAIIGLIYTVITGGGGYVFGYSVMLGPICLFLLIVTLEMRLSVKGLKNRFGLRLFRLRLYHYAFPVLLTYFSLPVIFNGLSIVFNWVGWPQMAGWFFAMRFWSLLIVVVKALVILFAYDTYKSRCRKRSTVVI
ncbi:MAG: hypothetical protein WC310_01870 [Patescibacteria group bacterium]|jgi:uncharacterized membrane protein